MTTPSLLAEVAAGQALSLSAAARRLPPSRGDRPVSPATIWRWARHGARTATGETVRLEVARVGGRWVTSEAAMLRFFQAQNPPAVPDAPNTCTNQTKTAAPRGRQAAPKANRAYEEAAAELTRRGI